MTDNNSNNIKKKCYIPVPNWNNHYEWPPIGGLRSLIFNKDKNGFYKVVKKVGKRVLIDEAAFFEWVENQGGK